MRELISLRAFGLSELDAVRYYVAMKMAERGLVSAPNMAVGLPFNIGLTGSCRQLPLGCGAASGTAAVAGRPTKVTNQSPTSCAACSTSDFTRPRAGCGPTTCWCGNAVARSLAEADTPGCGTWPAQWRADRVPAWTRENPFPQAEVMGPLRQADRLGREIDSRGDAVRGLPLLREDKVVGPGRRGGLDGASCSSTGPWSARPTTGRPLGCRPRGARTLAAVDTAPTWQQRLAPPDGKSRPPDTPER